MNGEIGEATLANTKRSPIVTSRTTIGISHQSFRCHKKLNNSLMTLARDPTFLLAFISVLLSAFFARPIPRLA
jgi:hypothetical protein